jgi:plastocyanin
MEMGLFSNRRSGRMFAGLLAILLTCAPGAARMAAAAVLDLRYVSVDGKGVAGAIVVLRNTDASVARAPSVVGTIDQLNRSFVPHTLVVPVGSQVLFPNSDTVSHQVYSFSSAKKFQLPLYRGKAHAPVLFDQPGVVTLGCNIHDQMRAYVFVVDAQYFGRTDDTGLWKARDIAPGEYVVQIWHPLAREMRPLVDQVVRVGEAAANFTLRAATQLRLRPVTQVPANWDAY